MATVAAETRIGTAPRPRSGAILPGPLTCVAIAFAAAVVVGAGASFGPAPGVAALVAVAVGLATMVQPMVGAMIILGVAPVISGLASGFPVPGFRLSELIIGGLGPLVLLTRQRRVPIRWGAFEWSVLLYCVATAVLGGLDLVQRSASFGPKDVGSLFGPFQLLITYLVVASVVVDDRWRRIALRVLLLASLPVGILAIMQEFNFPGVRQLLETATGANFFQVAASYAGSGGVARATGPFSGWSDLSAYLAAIILLDVALLLHTRIGMLRKRWLLVVLAVAVAAIVQTATIDSIAIAVLGTLVLARWYRQLGRVLMGFIPAVVVAGVAFLPLVLKRFASEFHPPPGTPGSHGSSLVPVTLQFRWDTWMHQWVPLLRGHWLTGFGPNLPSGIGWQWPDSLYLELILRGGIVLVLIQLGLMLAWILRASPLTSVTDPIRAGLGRVIMVLLVWLVIIHVIVPYFTDAGLPYVLFVLAGLCFGGAAAPARAPHRAERRSFVLPLRRPSPASGS